jgi:hypothetical protein
MIESSDYHLVIIQGPSGVGKTTAVQGALNAAGISYAHLSAYSTPLNFYNFLAANSRATILADDCSGIFNDQTSMALLKAATWSRAEGRRIVQWGSTSGRAVVPEFEFFGNFLIVCNSFPNSIDGEAIKSRGFAWQMEVSANEAKRLLIEATNNRVRFPNHKTALEVAQFLCERLTDETVGVINFRMLGKGYDLAKTHPRDWQKLLIPLLPVQKADPLELVLELDRGGMKVKEQVVLFEKKTNLKVRSFYKYRKDAGLSR